VLEPVGASPRPVQIVNHLNGEYADNIASDVRDGLSAAQKFIPCKYFYDAYGSKLFEEICGLPEYYPTRTELSILRELAPQLMAPFAHGDLVELGSGASLKIRTLLDAADESTRASLRYVPVDISESAVLEASEDLLERYPELQVLGTVADFTCQLDVLPKERALMLCFLGSTIGNMSEDEGNAFLRRVADAMKPGDALLVGFDMVKPTVTLEAAYNDSRGVTAEFNRNILRVVNNELNASFDPSDFDHLAFFNTAHSRIEMHLRANRDVAVTIESIGMESEFRAGETIHTENSRKFTETGIGDMASHAGLSVRDWYSDEAGWFSVVLMELASSRC
jgi:L-histidine N-alpha-methyltransferase